MTTLCMADYCAPQPRKVVDLRPFVTHRNRHSAVVEAIGIMAHRYGEDAYMAAMAEAEGALKEGRSAGYAMRVARIVLNGYPQGGAA